MPNKNSDPIFGEDDRGEKNLLDIIQRIARGNFEALDDLYSMPDRDGVGSNVSELAEAIGMILVRLEARDFYIEMANETEVRLETLNQLKNEHLGIAAHDLKNPISTIRGMSQMLVEMELDDETKTKFLE